jgi:hypothetical protein
MPNAPEKHHLARTIVASMLRNDLHARLEQLLAPEIPVVKVSDVDTLTAIARSNRVSAVFVDPTSLVDESISLIEAVAPMVVYTSISPDALRRTVELARRGVRHMVLYNYDDTEKRLRAMLDSLVRRSINDPHEGSGRQHPTGRVPAHSGEQVLVRIVDAGHAPPAEVAAGIVELITALDALHIAFGGSGLVIDSWDTYVRDPAGVGVL